MMNRTASVLLLSLVSATVNAGVFNAADFESSTVFYDLDNDLTGNGNTLYSDLWVDGGSDAYSSTTEAYNGDNAFVVDVIDDAEAAKDSYGTLYSKTLNLSMTSQVTVDFKYLVTNTSFAGAITNPDGSFSFEVSGDDGETWTTVFEVTSLDSIKSTLRQWTLDNGCGDIEAGEALEACIDELETSNIPESELKAYWSDSGTLTVPRSLMTNTTVLRIKSYLSSTHKKTKVYIDDLQINYQGNIPTLSAESLVPTTDNVTSSRVEYSDATFNSDDDWGVWQDGGRNVYTTDFLAEEGEGITLRYKYVEGEANEPDPTTGEDTGEHKPTYSSIYTKNLDMTEVEHLEVSFSFVGYNMSIVEEDSFTLSLSTNSGIDYTEIETWTVGEDFINLERYDVNVNIAGYLTSTSKLTTTTMLKLQSSNSSIESQVYIDNLTLYTIGTKNSPAGTPQEYDWSKFDQTILQADSSQSTYDLINNTLIREEFTVDKSWEGNNPDTDSEEVKEKPGIYGAVEHSDCTYEEFGEHITQAYDPALERDVFTFHIHQHLNEAGAYATPDTDRCRMDGLYDDRQRVEIKTYSQSKDHQKALQNETFYFAWRLKIPDGFQGSDKFTHLHQLKPVGGDYASMPLITLTAVGADYDYDSGSAVLSTPPQLNLRYSPTDVSQVTITSADISEMEGKWVQVLEKVKFGVENQGRYEIIITDPDNLDAEPYLSFTSYSLPMWKDGGDFIRPKWGIYRSIVQGHKLRDEKIKFSDFVILENSDGNAKEGDLLDFGEYVQGLENETTVSNSNYYSDLLNTISESAADNDTVTINSDDNTLDICSSGENATDSNPSGSTLCRSIIDLDSLVSFENAYECYENSGTDDCVLDQDYYLGIINGYIADDPESYGPYSLWRLGGTAVSGADAYYAYYYVIEYQMTEEDTILESFSYVGEGLFTFPDATPVETWKATAVIYYGEVCPTSFEVYCVPYNATDGYTSGDGELDSDVALFRESMVAGEYPIPSSGLALLNVLDELGDYEEVSQAVDALAAATYLEAHWGDFHEGDLATVEEIEMSLGYTANTKGVPLVTDDLLRYALAYVLFNDAFFNALDTGIGEAVDGNIGKNDVPDFIEQFVDDTNDALDWYRSQDNDDKYNTYKNKYLTLIMANKEHIEATTSGDDGQIEVEDLEYFSQHESEHLSLLSEAVQLITYNRAIFYRLDTGGNVFNWQNYPNGKISIDNMLSASEYIDFSLDGLINNVYQSLLLRAYEGEYSVSDDIKQNIGSILMAWDGNELLLSDPANVFEEDAIEHLEGMLDIAVEAALDADTSEWLSENLTTELDYWMPEGSVLRITFETYLVADLGYYTDGETEALALSLLNANDYDLDAAITALQEHLKPLQLFTEYNDRYDYLIEEVLMIMLDYFEGTVEVSEYIEQISLDYGLDYLPDDTISEDGSEVAEAYLSDALTIIKSASKANTSITKLFENTDKLFAYSKEQGFFTTWTDEDWQAWYKKGYLHAAKATATAMTMVAVIAEQDADYTDPEVQLALAMTCVSIGADIADSSGKFIKTVASVASKRVKEINTIIDDLSSSADDLFTKAYYQKELSYFKNVQTSTQSLATNLSKVSKVFSGTANGYAAYIAITNAVDAFENGNDVLGALYTIEAASTAVSSVSAAVELAVLYGYMSGYAATAGVFGGAAGAVAATVSLAIYSYQMHQQISYEYSLAEFREEAEQVFRPDIVNDDSVTLWTDDERKEWYCVRLSGNYLGICGWDEDDGSDDLDWIFSVDHPYEIATD